MVKIEFVGVEMQKYLLLILTFGLFLCSVAFAADGVPPWPVEEPSVQPPSPDRFYYEFMRMMMVLAVILVILFAVSWFLKRFMNVRVQQINATSPIKIIETRALSPKTSIYVVEIYNKRFAFAESHNAMTCLGEVSEEQAPGRSFSDVMHDRP